MLNNLVMRQSVSFIVQGIGERFSIPLPIFLVVFSLLGFYLGSAFAADYEVGQGKAYTAIGDVPWESLQPGDIVLIHWRPTPYNEKWVICRRGIESKPIVVRGVPDPDGAGNSQIVHYGGDSRNTDGYRKGILYFYNNTVISGRRGNTTLFRLSTNDEHADCRNNIVYVTANGDRLAILASEGTLDITHNWFKTGWVESHSDLTGIINDDGTAVTGAYASHPGFVDETSKNYRLESVSECINRGTALHEAVMPHHDLLYHYARHRASETRPRIDALDIGAYEY